MEMSITFWTQAVRPCHWRINVIVGANCTRPLLTTSAAHLYVRESHKYEMPPLSLSLFSFSFQATPC